MGVEQPRSENFSTSNIWLAAGADGDIDLEYLKYADPPVSANCMDENGYTPMHAAVAYDRLDIVQLLVSKYEGNVNIQDFDGDGPLHVVETEQMARLLIGLGADPHLKNNKGYLAIQIADKEEYDGVVQYLKDFTPDYDKVIESDDEENDLEQLETSAVHVQELLRQYGINMTFSNDNNESESDDGANHPSSHE